MLSIRDPWWRHAKETISTSLALGKGNLSVNGGPPHKGPVICGYVTSLLIVWGPFHKRFSIEIRWKIGVSLTTKYHFIMIMDAPNLQKQLQCTQTNRHPRLTYCPPERCGNFCAYAMNLVHELIFWFTLRWIPQYNFGYRSTLIHAMVLCRQASSQCGFRCVSSCDVTWSQWVNTLWSW